MPSKDKLHWTWHRQHILEPISITTPRISFTNPWAQSTIVLLCNNSCKKCHLVSTPTTLSHTTILFSHLLWFSLYSVQYAKNQRKYIDAKSVYKIECWWNFYQQFISSFQLQNFTVSLNWWYSIRSKCKMLMKLNLSRP